RRSTSPRRRRPRAKARSSSTGCATSAARPRSPPTRPGRAPAPRSQSPWPGRSWRARGRTVTPCRRCPPDWPRSSRIPGRGTTRPASRSAPRCDRPAACASASLAHDVDHHLAAVAAVPMLPDVNALPRAEDQLALPHRHLLGGTGEGRLHVRGHVVVALGHVGEERVAVGDEAAQERLEVALYGRIRVLLDEEAGRGVPDEDRAQALANARAAEDAPHAAGDLGQAPPGRHAERLAALLHLIRGPLGISLGVSLGRDGGAMMLRRATRVAAVVALAAIAGCGGGSSPTVP